MHALLRILCLVALVYGCYAVLLIVAQRWLIYPGRTISVAGPPPNAAGLEQLWLATPAGRTEAWFLPAAGSHPSRRQPVVLFFHGNGEVIDFLPEQLSGLRALGLHLLLVEYPGYGRSAGAPGETANVAAAVAAYDAMVQRGDVDPARIVAFGRSLGGGVACGLSRQRPLAALILQSPFTSTRPFARKLLLPGFLVRDRYDNEAALRSFPGPVLIVHGRHDDIVPFSHGAELARVAGRATFVPLACAHNDCPPDPATFWRLVGEFLRQVGVR
jgi:fermentation-respiration switch protein FrsA (DUF1100 family)